MPRAAPGAFDPARIERFRYVDFHVDEHLGELRCRYALDDELEFTERIGLGRDRRWSPAAHEAARLLFLLVGVSYYKTAAPPVVDLGATAVRDGDLAFLRSFYLDGLGEFAYRNGLHLESLEITGGDAARAPVPYEAALDAPLIPFGGGIDSIVTVETVRAHHPDAALFVVSRRGDRFSAIEDAAAVTGLPVVRADRELDAQLLTSAARGFRNGHVPVTGILSGIAVLSAILEGRSAVVMSNEWSASSGNVEVGGVVINHQHSKSWAFETDFRQRLESSFERPPQYFSLLRPYSELWIAQRFSELTRYHAAFRSCNRAFHIDPAQRLGTWCGVCDKCCFVDLVLAPFMRASDLEAVFAGREPLRNDTLAPVFRTLLATSPELAKPFECVGDVQECRVAAVQARARPDRQHDVLLPRLVAELGPAAAAAEQAGARLLRPMGPSHAPEQYAPVDLLV